jgi:DNA modification methylase
VKPYYSHAGITIYHGDCREVLPTLESDSIRCCVTSPPYWGLRDYGEAEGIGQEETPAEWLEKLGAIFLDVQRILAEDGTLWVNCGDTYAAGGHGWGGGGISQDYNHSAVCGGPRDRKPPACWNLKKKDLIGLPWRLAFRLQEDGWYLRRDIIWSKPNTMPESVTDRPTGAHEYIFLLSRSEKYYYNQEATLEPVSKNTHMRLSHNLAAQIGSHRANGGAKTNGPMKAVGRKAAAGTPGIEKSNPSFETAVCLPVTERNKRTVWTVVPAQGEGDHTATYPEELILPCILAGAGPGDCVLDPFAGTGTTLLVAKKNHSRGVGIEIEEKYCEIAAKRLSQEVLAF